MQERHGELPLPLVEREMVEEVAATPCLLQSVQVLDGMVDVDRLVQTQGKGEAATSSNKQQQAATSSNKQQQAATTPHSPLEA